MKLRVTLIATALALFAWGTVRAEDAKPADKYPLDTCVVSGEKLGGEMGEPYALEYEGQKILLCCKGCVKKFKADPAKYLAKIEAAKTAADAKADQPADAKGAPEAK